MKRENYYELYDYYEKKHLEEEEKDFNRSWKRRKEEEKATAVKEAIEEAIPNEETQQILFPYLKQIEGLDIPSVNIKNVSANGYNSTFSAIGTCNKNNEHFSFQIILWNGKTEVSLYKNQPHKGNANESHRIVDDYTFKRDNDNDNNISIHRRSGEESYNAIYDDMGGGRFSGPHYGNVQESSTTIIDDGTFKFLNEIIDTTKLKNDMTR